VWNHPSITSEYRETHEPQQKYTEAPAGEKQDEVGLGTGRIGTNRDPGEYLSAVSGSKDSGGICALQQLHDDDRDKQPDQKNVP
jgi:hypothetical protein